MIDESTVSFVSSGGSEVSLLGNRQSLSYTGFGDRLLLYRGLKKSPTDRELFLVFVIRSDERSFSFSRFYHLRDLYTTQF